MRLKSLLGGCRGRVVARLCASRSKLWKSLEGEVAFLIRIADGLERNIDAHVFGTSLSTRGWRRTMARTRDLRRMRSEVLGRLETLGVKRMEPTERVDLRRHDIDVVLDSPRAEDEGRLAGVYVEGYETVDGVVVRRALVTVMRFLPAILRDGRNTVVQEGHDQA